MMWQMSGGCAVIRTKYMNSLTFSRSAGLNGSASQYKPEVADEGLRPGD
jgi:hypothetical protein